MPDIVGAVAAALGVFCVGLGIWSAATGTGRGFLFRERRDASERAKRLSYWLTIAELILVGSAAAIWGMYQWLR